MVFEASAVRALARKREYVEITSELRNNLLVLKNVFKRGCGGTDNQWGPVEIKVNLISQSVSASMNHHKLGKCVYERKLEDLKKLDKVFINPRTRRVPYKIEKEATRMGTASQPSSTSASSAAPRTTSTSSTAVSSAQPPSSTTSSLRVANGTSSTSESTLSTSTSTAPLTPRASVTTMPPTDLLLNQAQNLLTQPIGRPVANTSPVLPGRLVQLPNGQLQVQPHASVISNNNTNTAVTQVPSSSQTKINQINLPSTSNQAVQSNVNRNVNNNRIAAPIPTPTISGHKKVASIYDIGSNTVTVNSAGQFVVMGPNPTAVANLIASIQGGGEIEIRNNAGDKNVLILYAQN